MKILFFSPYYYPYTSGLTTYPFKVLRHLAKAHEITVLAFPHKKGVKREEEMDGYTIKRLPYLFKISKGFISPQSLFYFLTETAKHDMIILNQPNFEGLCLAVVGMLMRKKMISLLHCKLHLTGNFITGLINAAVDISVFLQLAMSRRIIGYTEDYVSSIPMMGVFKNKTVFCLPPVEKLACDQAFRTELLKKKRYKVWIGFAGRIAREKGIEYLITALKGIKNCELVFAGPYGADVAGENPYYQRILAQLQQSNTPYIFFGNLRGCQLGTFYKTVDMLVLPSINQTEAFGMVQAECMMTGTPVIASDLPGVRVPIQMTKMGMLVESKNSIELRRAIKHIIANRSTYSNEALRKHAESLFDIRKVLHFYDKLFV